MTSSVSSLDKAALTQEQVRQLFHQWLAAELKLQQRQNVDGTQEAFGLKNLVEGFALLSEELREVVFLRHIRRWTINEIAEFKKISTVQVSRLLRKGLAKLRLTM